MILRCRSEGQRLNPNKKLIFHRKGIAHFKWLLKIGYPFLVVLTTHKVPHFLRNSRPWFRHGKRRSCFWVFYIQKRKPVKNFRKLNEIKWNSESIFFLIRGKFVGFNVFRLSDGDRTWRFIKF
jgi:hypothetical protein